MNKIILIGNMCNDATLTETESGIKFASFDLAVRKNFKGAEGTSDADYFRIIAWKGLAETIAQYTKKGNKIAITGRLQNRSYEKDGEKKFIIEVVADEIEFLTTKQGEKIDKDLKEIPSDGLPF